MPLVNLTPHPIAVYGSRPVEDGPEEIIEPSGKVGRVATIELGTGMSKHSGPFVEVRNEQGTMIGCRHLQRVC
jgi:hypothetical protein